MDKPLELGKLPVLEGTILLARPDQVKVDRVFMTTSTGFGFQFSSVAAYSDLNAPDTKDLVGCTILADEAEIQAHLKSSRLLRASMSKERFEAIKQKALPSISNQDRQSFRLFLSPVGSKIPMAFKGVLNQTDQVSLGTYSFDGSELSMQFAPEFSTCMEATNNASSKKGTAYVS